VAERDNLSEKLRIVSDRLECTHRDAAVLVEKTEKLHAEIHSLSMENAMLHRDRDNLKNVIISCSFLFIRLAEEYAKRRCGRLK
jgi:hypothetical protein